MSDDPSLVFRDAVRSARPYVVGGADDVRAKLNQNESPYDLPADLKREIGGLLAGIELNRYPSEQPSNLVRELADYAGVSPAFVLVSHGSNEFVHTLFLSLIDPGRVVALPRPMFALFLSAAKLFAADVTEVPALPDLEYDVDRIVEAAREADLTVLACPNNPTGKDLDLASIERIARSAKGIVVVDEAYWEFTDRPSCTALLPNNPNLVIMRTLSKAFGLAAMRIGYTVADPRVIEQFMKVRLPFMVDPFAEQVGVAVLRARDGLLSRTADILAARQRLESELRAIAGVDVVSSVTNFFLFRSGVEPDVLRAALAADGVVVRSMAAYPEIRQFLRVSAGSEEENRRFLAALKKALFA